MSRELDFGLSRFNKGTTPDVVGLSPIFQDELL